MEQKKKTFCKAKAEFCNQENNIISGIFKLGNNQKFFFTYCRCAEKTFKFSAVNKS